ncbi:pyridoxamine 5'-phosphate oxidase family protein [Aldersonia sp. NBC_00410]|uniref:hypothetical protein n=1 Tax=Aldersonia sp. NBC_00410 TaxID=2975954 RepID=UPI00224F511C|nr:hypothetical protein [Aldersonia sp. NBC_00410]MCX5044406.1 pyridoxamine 5'-phosphate oxidase family protein [Aldersonia sp. NBC_00410]
MTVIHPPRLDWTRILEQASAHITTEYASLRRDGAPVTWPVTPYRGVDDRTIDVSTGITYPLKAERARRNPKVALSFSNPVGSGLDAPATFVVQGLATVRDADLRANSARYLQASYDRFPGTMKSVPDFMMRRMMFYWARVWIEVTPVRVLCWPDGNLDHEPRIWTTGADTVAPQSDPEPAGRGAGSWSNRPAPDWRDRTHEAIDRLGMPVLTTTTADGWPLPLRVRAAERTETGFVVRPPAGVEITDGPGCLTLHTHGSVFDSQENITLTGRCERTGDDVAFTVERTLNEVNVPRNPVRRMLNMLTLRRELQHRLAAEAARRGQAVPSFDELGFRR